MDNFHLQVTPVEVTYESKDPISLSCLFKKVVISTGHLLEKHQIKSSSQLSFGKARFQEGPTFAMSKQFQARNTKISLHFLAKKDRNISCIGSTEIYVGNLPSQPYSLIQLKLDNCNDPKAKLKLQIQRKQQQPKQMKKNNKPEKMGLLQTEGQQKQQFLLSQRANPSIPTAYQISRRNYKNVQIINDDKKDKKSSSSKKISYQQRHNVLNQLNPTNKSNNTSLIKNQIKTNHNNSPMPRRQTPQPIQINKHTKPSVIAKPSENSKYNISGKAKIGVETRQNKKVVVNTEQAVQQPQNLKVKPYSEEDSQNYQTINRNGLQSLEQQKKYKYKFITQKLQLIHDKIANSKQRVNTENYSNNNSQFFQQNHRSCIQKSIPQNKSQELHRVKSIVGEINSFNPLTNLKIQESPKILNQSNDSNSLKGEQIQQYENVEKKFQNIKSVKNKSPQLSPSPPSSKTVTIKNSQTRPMKSQQRVIKGDSLTDKQIQQVQIQMYMDQIKKYKVDLANAFRTIKQKDNKILQMEKDIGSYQQTIQQKQNLLTKINQQYQLIFHQNFQLKQQIARPQLKRQESAVGQFRLSQTSSIKQDSAASMAKINDEMLKMKKKLLQMQSQLKFKQNENKCLTLQIDNIRRQKKNLQQQVEILVSKDRNQITRKASIARIEQITTNSLAHNAKKQNEILKNQVKILQQKLQSLNSLFQSLIHPNSQKSKNKVLPLSSQTPDNQTRLKVLQQKCTLLQQQLKKKKNQLAQIINIIWKHQNGDLMNEVFALITQTQS